MIRTSFVALVLVTGLVAIAGCDLGRSPAPTVPATAGASPVVSPTVPVAASPAAATVVASPTALATRAVTGTLSPVTGASPVATSSPAATAARTSTPGSTAGAGTPQPGASPVACAALDPVFSPLQQKASTVPQIFSQASVFNCPVRPSLNTGGAIQEFRKPITTTGTVPPINYMLWREDTRTIYLLVKSDPLTGVSRAYTYPDTWTSQDPSVPPDCAAIIPPQDNPPATDPSRALQIPVRGFGKVWCRERWQEAIGFGNGREVGGQITVQETQGGVYIAVRPSDGRETTSLFLIDTRGGGALAP